MSRISIVCYSFLLLVSQGLRAGQTGVITVGGQTSNVTRAAAGASTSITIDNPGFETAQTVQVQ
jgi:1-aminocyclopropane-1-carboxylate deaminase/D-cysteine desulfhydrase-like pyridoxal-dependent ACC family enzyme